MVLGIIAAGTVGYVLLGFGVLDAAYQTVTTITTVGFREVHPLDEAGKIFTIVLILAGSGTALYAFGRCSRRWWRVTCAVTSKGAGWSATSPG